MEKFLILDGVKYYLTSNKKYYYSDEKRNGIRVKRSYHRTLYETVHKITIPLKHHIHHIDGNTHNNSIENLEMILGYTHLGDHVRERWRNPEYKANALMQLDIQREKTKAWHASEAGHKWHSENSKKSWAKRILYKKNCEICNNEFETYRPTIAKVCSINCNQKRAYRLKIGFKSKKCVICNKEFKVRSNEPTKTCSQACGIKSRVYKKKK